VISPWAKCKFSASICYSGSTSDELIWLDGYIRGTLWSYKLSLIRSLAKFHIFVLQTYKSLKIVIKGIFFDVSEEKLSNELKDLGFQPKFFRAFQKNNKRIRVHMVSLKRSLNVKDIFTMDSGHSFLRYNHSNIVVRTGPIMLYLPTFWTLLFTIWPCSSLCKDVVVTTKVTYAPKNKILNPHAASVIESTRLTTMASLVYKNS